MDVPQERVVAESLLSLAGEKNKRKQIQKQNRRRELFPSPHFPSPFLKVSSSSNTKVCTGEHLLLLMVLFFVAQGLVAFLAPRSFQSLPFSWPELSRKLTQSSALVFFLAFPGFSPC
jgi:hypothetical protein